MTNGGGASEEDRSRKLTEQLGYEVSPKTRISARSHFYLLCEDHYFQLYAGTYYFEVPGAQVCQQTGARSWG